LVPTEFAKGSIVKSEDHRHEGTLEELVRKLGLCEVGICTNVTTSLNDSRPSPLTLHVVKVNSGVVPVRAEDYVSLEAPEFSCKQEHVYRCSRDVTGIHTDVRRNKRCATAIPLNYSTFSLGHKVHPCHHAGRVNFVT